MSEDSKAVEAAKKAAKVAGTAAAVATVIGLRVEGRPVKAKDQPAKVRALGLTWFERDGDGRQWVLWFRIRNARK